MVQQFIGNVINHLDGRANGSIHFAGRIENPYLKGSASLENASFMVDYTKVKYKVDSGVIEFNNDGIDFGQMTVSDQLNRKAIFKGKILNQGFKHFEVYEGRPTAGEFTLERIKELGGNLEAVSGLLFSKYFFQ